MTARRTILIAACLLANPLSAQTLQREAARASAPPQTGISRSYRVRQLPSTQFRNSSRFSALIKDGKLFLSLQDAIALAIENNLDIEVERYVPHIADSDLLRAQAGSSLRGVPLTVLSGPAGVGGPVENPPGGAPPLTPSSSTIINSGFNPSQSDLSLTGPVPLSPGSPIPSFDPHVTGLLGPSYSNTPQASSFLTGNNLLVEHSLTANLGVQQGFASGAVLDLGYLNLRQSYNNGRLDINPYTASSLGLTLTQPLLQGFGFGLNRRYIRIATNNERVADLAFRQQLIITVSNIIQLYWDLVSLNQDVEVKRDSLRLANKLLEDNKAHVEVGTLAPLEVVRAQAEVAQAHQALGNSESLVLEQELVLKNALSRTGTADPAIASIRIVPTDRIEVPADDQLPPLSDLVAQALQHRPDLEAGQVQIENAQLALKGSRNALLPSLNLVASVQGNGIIGQVNSLLPPGTPPGTAFTRAVDPSFVGGYGAALSQILHGNYPNYGVALQLDVPLRNRAARADLARDQLILRQSEVRLKQLQNQIRVQVEAALIAVRQARDSYRAAVETRVLQEKALRDIQQQFEVGVAKSYDVILNQRDLAQARSNEVVAMSDYIKARTALDRATGMTLENNSILLDDAFRGQVPQAPGVPASAQN
ncbi:MAG TPA: TolC family protein [Terriglobia bacterium]|nr:TolC family protein [Terriglobia bacterium]